MVYFLSTTFCQLKKRLLNIIDAHFIRTDASAAAVALALALQRINNNAQKFNLNIECELRSNDVDEYVPKLN